TIDRMLNAIAITMPLYVMASSHHMPVGVLLRSAISLISLNDTVGVKKLYTAMIATTTIRNGVTNPSADRILLKPSVSVIITAIIMMNDPSHAGTPKLCSSAEPPPASMMIITPYRKNISI